MVSMNRLSRYQRVEIVKALVEGNSIRATCRVTGAARGTVLKLLEYTGAACWEYSDPTLRGLTAHRSQRKTANAMNPHSAPPPSIR